MVPHSIIEPLHKIEEHLGEGTVCMFLQPPGGKGDRELAPRLIQEVQSLFS